MSPSPAYASVRYLVDDVQAAVDFYTTHLGFTATMSAAPAFAEVARAPLRLLLSGAASSGYRATPDDFGAPGRNRIHLIVDDLDAEVQRLRDGGVAFRSDVVGGPGGRQILIADPRATSSSCSSRPRVGPPRPREPSARAEPTAGPGRRDRHRSGRHDRRRGLLGLRPAAAAAGSGLLVGLGIAAVIAFCNAASSAQLAAVYPTSGGTYLYGRERLGGWWGFIAGWAFVIGKTASCAAMALTFATYASPHHETLQRGIAIAAVVALAALNYRGVAKTAVVTRVLVAGTLVALTVLVAGIWTGGDAHWSNVGSWADLAGGGIHGTLQAAGLLFFAFAGYARVATLGEEVRDPARTIPRAILIALSITLAVYIAVALSALAAAGPDALARADAPLATAIDAAGAGALGPAVRIGAAIASLGTLLALLAGVGAPAWRWPATATCRPGWRRCIRAIACRITLRSPWPSSSAPSSSSVTSAPSSASRRSACWSTTPSPTSRRSPSPAASAVIPERSLCSAPSAA